MEFQIEDYHFLKNNVLLQQILNGHIHGYFYTNLEFDKYLDDYRF